MSGARAQVSPCCAWHRLAAEGLPISLPALTIICMETNSPAIIADTSALVSLAIDTDHNHTVATGEAAKLQDAALPIILPADVFVETINILGKRRVLALYRWPILLMDEDHQGDWSW